MTKKTIEDVRRYFAEEIMGWEKSYDKVVVPDNNGGVQLNNTDKGFYLDQDMIHQHEEENWKPDKNLEQVFECLEEYDKYFHMIHTSSDAVHDSSAEIKTKNGFAEFVSNNPCKLILGCILKAENQTELLEVLEDSE